MTEPLVGPILICHVHRGRRVDTKPAENLRHIGQLVYEVDERNVGRLVVWDGQDWAEVSVQGRGLYVAEREESP